METDLSGKRVTIFGMGRSALGAVRLLLREGAVPFVTECREMAALEDFPAQLDALGVPFETGGHSRRAFEEADLVVLSPGVPWDLSVSGEGEGTLYPYSLEALRSAGVPVIGELELGWRFCRSRALAVTGTNGKTTVTELLRAMIAACGHTVALAGNNDTPLCEAVLADPAPEYIVLEVSSYQLESVETFHPWIAAVLNLTPDHLGRHKTMEEYARVKQRIFRRQGLGDVSVINLDDPWTAAMETPDDARRMAFSLECWSLDGLWPERGWIKAGDEVVAKLADSPLPGRHNLANVLAALAMMRGGGFAREGVLSGLRAFRGVEHRIEHVLALDGVDYFNDSKSTNVDSLRVALESFDQSLVLIAGGRGKGSDYRVLRDRVGEQVKHLIVLGEDAPKLTEAFGDLVPAEEAGTMADAVRRAHAAAAPGDVVLLSPGCASFDWYRNFEERGRDFKACVRRLAAKEDV